MSLSAKILIGFVLGIAAGIFFGEWTTPLAVVGDGFVMLLQMTVLPYMVTALVGGLGQLTVQRAVSMAKSVGLTLLVLWAITLIVVLIMPLAFPERESASFFSATLVEERAPFNFLDLYIPANPFRSLVNQMVPAVGVFSMALGIALIGMERKQGLIDLLATVTEALGRITGAVVELAPIGVFAVAAHVAGTLGNYEFQQLQVYVIVYIAMSLLLVFWTLPGLIAAVTPFRYREVLRYGCDAFLTAFATGNSFVALPMLTEKAKELFRDRYPTPMTRSRRSASSSRPPIRFRPWAS